MRRAISASRATRQRIGGPAAPIDRRHEQPRVGDERREILRDDRRDLVEDRVAGARQRGIAELAHDPRAEHERLDLIAVEHERRQVVAGTDAIADARFAVDRRAGEDQIADVAVDRALRYAEPFGKVRGGRRRPAPPQHVDDLEQPIGSTHRTDCAIRRPGLRRGRSRGPPDPRRSRASRRAGRCAA